MTSAPSLREVPLTRVVASAEAVWPGHTARPQSVHVALAIVFQKRPRQRHRIAGTPSLRRRQQDTTHANMCMHRRRGGGGGGGGGGGVGRGGWIGGGGGGGGGSLRLNIYFAPPPHFLKA